MNARYQSAAELRAAQTLKARQYIREAAAEAIRYLQSFTGESPYDELRLLRKAEFALEDIKANLDLLNEELDCAPSDREVGLAAAFSIDRERSQEINRG